MWWGSEMGALCKDDLGVTDVTNEEGCRALWRLPGSVTDNFEVACADAVGKNGVLGGERQMLDWPVGVHVVVTYKGLNFIIG